MPRSVAPAPRPVEAVNRPGVEALYLSLEPETALAEYRQGVSIVQPATLAAFVLELADIADLSAGYDAASWDAAWAGWDCDWRWIARIEKSAPPSWTLGDIAIRAGLRGLLFPSTQAAHGTNLVIFNANLTTGDHLAVHDPEDKLPRNQESWR